MTGRCPAYIGCRQGYNVMQPMGWHEQDVSCFQYDLIHGRFSKVGILLAKAGVLWVIRMVMVVKARRRVDIVRLVVVTLCPVFEMDL